MSYLKNKFVIIVIVAILAGGSFGLYLSAGNSKPKPPAPYVGTGSGVDPQKVGEVIQKLNKISE